MARSELTIDLGAIRRNARAIKDGLEGGAELFAVVKANGYGHGATDASGAALSGGASALCVVTLGEALALRREFPTARIIVMGPLANREVATAREAKLELVVAHGELPHGIPLHLKLETGMGRFGLAELPVAPVEVVGLMSHLATADSDVAFVEHQLARFLEATKLYPQLPRHLGNSAAALRIPSTHLEAVRCGIALYGLSPFGQDPALDGLEPALRWESQLAQVKLLDPGSSTGYGRRFVAEEPTWIGLVPVGYADGFRRDLTGTTVLVDGERCEAVGTVSMDSFAVRLPRELPAGTPVTLVGDGLLLEEHAHHARTITYELACGIGAAALPARARRVVVDS